MPRILKSFRVPAPFFERMGFFAFFWILGKGRPPPDAEASRAKARL